MPGTKPSRTAQGVGAERAVLADMGVLDDRYARDMLPPAMSLVRNAVRLWPLRHLRTRSVTLAGLATRVLWYDTLVVRALDAGIRQVAVVGAGYDTRAWRFRRDGVTFFEVDHPATQQDKKLRAPGPGPTYVAGDLRTDALVESLQRFGMDMTSAAVFILEGLTMYLTEDVLRHQLAELAKASATGNRLALDFHPPDDAGTQANRRQARLQRIARSGSGETVYLTADRAQATELVESTGWAVVAVEDTLTAAATLLGRGSGLPIDKINPRKSLIAAVRP